MIKLTGNSRISMTKGVTINGMEPWWMCSDCGTQGASLMIHKGCGHSVDGECDKTHRCVAQYLGPHWKTYASHAAFISIIFTEVALIANGFVITAGLLGTGIAYWTLRKRHEP